MKDEWRMNKEWWRMTDEGWMLRISSCWGVFLTDWQTNRRTFVNVESLLRLKTSLTSFKSEMDGWTNRLPIKFLLIVHLISKFKLFLFLINYTELTLVVIQCDQKNLKFLCFSFQLNPWFTMHTVPDFNYYR